MGPSVNATRILWGQILIVFAIVIASVWGATQWTAWQLGYQPQLGDPWFVVAGHPVYLPPAFFWWWYAFDAYAPEVFERGGYIAVGGGLSSVIVAMGHVGLAGARGKDCHDIRFGAVGDRQGGSGRRPSRT